MAGVAYRPQTETMAQIHGICNITLGTIATTSILVRPLTILMLEYFLTSYFRLAGLCRVTKPCRQGTNTGIHYFDDYEEYLKILEMGLCQKKKSIYNIIKKWDSRIFPNTELSIISAKEKSTDNGGVKRAMGALDADSEEDEVVES